MFTKRKSSIDDMVRSRDVANILGISKSLLMQRIHLGFYNDIEMRNTSGGILYNIFDVFKYAHPHASNDLLERMIYDFRMIKTKARTAARAKYRKKLNAEQRAKRLQAAKNQGVK